MRYIGGKSLLLDNILEVIKDNTTDVKTVIDIFAGSVTYNIKRYRHSVYEALYIDTKQEGTDEQGNPKIVGYIGISTPIDLIDNGIWKFEITKNIEVFHDAYYDFHEYTIKNCCNVNVCEKTKVESLGNVMDFISSNKQYFLAVKKLKRNLLLKMGLV